MSKKLSAKVEPVIPPEGIDGEQPPETAPKKKKKTKAERKAAREAKALKKKLAALEVRYKVFRKYLNFEVQFAEFTHHYANESWEEICTFLQIPELIKDERFKSVLTKINKKKLEIRTLLKDWALVDENPASNVKDKGDIVQFMSV